MKLLHQKGAQVATKCRPFCWRLNFMAILIAGAGAAYLSGGGFGLWEMAFNALMLIPAYKGLQSYRFIGIGWLLHTGWDILHHLYGNPILPFDATSSLRCAVCDPVLAIWCFAGASSPYPHLLTL
jgi:hypothetical protein